MPKLTTKKQRAICGTRRRSSKLFRESKLGPHSITMHEDKCAFGAVLWPRACTPIDVEEMQDAVAERERECRCKPLVMYVGAMA